MRTLAIAISALILVVTITVAAGPQATVAHPLVTKAEYDRWQKELSNWGRWGNAQPRHARQAQAGGSAGEGRDLGLSRFQCGHGKGYRCPMSGRMGDADSQPVERNGSDWLPLHPRRRHDPSGFIRSRLLRRENVERLSRCRRGYDGPRRRKEFHSDDEERDRYTGCSV